MEDDQEDKDHTEKVCRECPAYAPDVEDGKEVRAIHFFQDQGANQIAAEYEEHVHGDPPEHEWAEPVRELTKIMREHYRDGHSAAQAVECFDASLSDAAAWQGDTHRRRRRGWGARNSLRGGHGNGLLRQYVSPGIPIKG